MKKVSNHCGQNVKKKVESIIPDPIFLQRLHHHHCKLHCIKILWKRFSSGWFGNIIVMIFFGSEQKHSLESSVSVWSSSIIKPFKLRKWQHAWKIAKNNREVVCGQLIFLLKGKFDRKFLAPLNHVVLLKRKPFLKFRVLLILHVRKTKISNTIA